MVSIQHVFHAVRRPTAGLAEDQRAQRAAATAGKADLSRRKFR